ncbi:hypothetical protein V6N13_113327 [Hibiscus sabdariffa]
MAITEANKDLKVDEKSKSVENLGELDERSHKKAKLDCSVKVSNEKNENDGLMPNRYSNGNDSEDKLSCATNPNGASENSPTKLKADDELTKPSSSHPNEGIETTDEASGVANRADFVSGVLELPPSFLSFCLSLGAWSSKAHQGKNHWG